ncbi:MAG: GNAT family N-acetyltransferase [Polyangiaceae bacterium]|nr:GNAT family N-acetyltransferase [Polyangiaceae bacterium]
MEVRAATEEERRARDALTHSAWGGGLDVDQYAAREARLRGHAWARGAMETWLAVGDDGAILSSCESFASRSYLDGEQGVTYAIASVFTAPALRGRGHAVAMLRELVDRLRPRPRAHAVTLYSDVGARIYERAGFLAVTSLDRSLPAEPGDPTEGVTPLGEGEVRDAPPPAARFVVWPDAPQLDWHRERERAYAALLGRPRPPLAGARTEGGEIVFVGDLKGARLLVLRLRADTEQDARRLLRSAARAAHAAGLPRVVAWEDPLVAPRVPVGAVAPREGGLAMIHPLAPRLSASEWHVIPRGAWV